MAFQFVHVDTYSRAGAGKARSMAQIVAEAERRPDACPHVEKPDAPRLLFGVMPSEAATEACSAAETVRDAKGRKLRKDAPVIAAGVISLPAERAEDWPTFREASLRWLKKRYGDRLRSVIEHTDEEHPHIHFYAVPRPGEGCEVVHEGYRARVEARQRGDKAGAVRLAYKRAMRALQDAFAADVAGAFGLARLGPRRQRLSRAEWTAQKVQLQAIAEARRRLVQTVKKQVAKKAEAAEKQGFTKGVEAGRKAGAGLGQRLDAFLGELGGSRRSAAELSDQVEELTRELTQSKRDAHTLERIADDKQELWRAAEQKASAATAEARELQSEVSKLNHEVAKWKLRAGAAEEAEKLVAALSPQERIDLHIRIQLAEQQREASVKPQRSEPDDTPSPGLRQH